MATATIITVAISVYRSQMHAKLHCTNNIPIAQSSTGKGKNEETLFSNSYHPGYSWFDYVNRGIASDLMGRNIKLFIEYLDTKMRGIDGYFQMEDMRRYKYDNETLDAIIAFVANQTFADVLLRYIRDQTRVFFSIRESQILADDRSPVPDYSLRSPQPDMGVMGRSILSGYLQGRKVGERILALLIDDNKEKGLLTRQTIQGRNIIPNEPSKHFNEYPWKVIFTIIFLLAQSSIIILLLVNRNRRIKTEQSLREVQNRMMNAIEAADIMLWEADPVKDVCWAIAPGHKSRDIKALLSANLEEFFQSVHPDDLEPLQQSIQRAIEYRESIDIKYRIVFSDKRITWVNTKGRVVQDRKGTTSLVGGITFDITELRQSQTNLQRSERLFGTLLSATHDVALLFDEEGTIIDCNDSFLALAGTTTREALIGTCIFDRFAEKEAGLRMSWIRRALDKEEPVRFEDYLGRADKYFETTLFPISGPAGDDKILLMMAQDITDRIKAEIALNESEEKFRRLIENIPDVTWTSDLAGNTIYISDNIQKVFGFSSDEILANPDAWLGRIHQDDADRVIEKYVHLFQGGERFDTEYRIRHKDGHWMWLHDRSMFCYEKDGVQYADGLFTDITDRKRAERDLSQIFSMSLDMLSISDLDSSTFLRVNPAFEKILGYPEEELLDKSFLHFIHPEDVEATRAVVEQKLQMGSNVINFDNRYRCRDGTYRWLSWVAHPQQEEGIIIAVARDITEWRKNQESLKKSKELLDATGRMAKVGGWELDAETMEVTWTNETYRIHGVSLGYKIILEEALNFFHPDDRERMRQAVQRSLDYGEPYDMEIRFITAQGELLWTRTVCQPKVVDGKTVKLKGTFQDISERKRMEQEIKKNEERLLAAQQIARLGYWEWETATDQLIWSDVMYQLYDIELGTPLTFEYLLDRIHPGDRKQHEQLAADLLAGKTGPSFSYRIVRLDGSLRYIYGVGMRKHDEKGALAGLKGTLQDVTELKTVEMAYRDSEARLKEAQAETINLNLEMAHLNRIMTMNELAASFAHEINQPLGAIINNASVAKILNSNSVEGKGNLGEILEDIVGDAQRAGQIIRKIRGVMQKGESVFIPIDINNLIDSVIALYENSSNLHHISVVTEKDERLVPVKGDEVRLQQVLINLITNAMEAMSDSPQKVLTFKTLYSGDMVKISISDTGTGIEKGSAEQVFDPFYTTKRDGIGIGLRLCRSIIEEHGGKIWIESNGGTGTTFQFTLKVFSGE